MHALLVNCQVAFTAEYLATSDLSTGHVLQLIFHQPPEQYLAMIVLVVTKVQDLPIFTCAYSLCALVDWQL